MNKAQDISGTLSVEDYKTIQVINNQHSKTMSLGDIEYQPVNGSWSELTTSLGVTTPSCTTNEAGNNCYVEQSGLKIYYSDRLGDFTMGSLTIANTNFTFKIKGQSIKIGDNISKLSSVHADAYNKRQTVPRGQSFERQVLLILEYTDLSISFFYDSRTNKITEILVFQSLV